MDALKSIVLILSVLRVVDDVCGECNLSLHRDFSNPSPVFIRNGKFLAPDAKGAILLQRSETLQVACVGDKRYIYIANVTTQSNVLEAHCIVNATFRVNRWIGQFKEIRCNSPPMFSVQKTKESCYGGNQIYRVGYEIKRSFHKLYEACFDSNLLSTLYVKHEISPSSIYTQSGKSRPQFAQGNLFGKINVNKLYTAKHQKERFDEILGAEFGHTYITNKQFLSRGHLAPRGDFNLEAERRATFHFVNAAPQWMLGNAGDWAALEDGLRRHAHNIGANLTIYTGTYDVLVLPDQNGGFKQVYLEDDENNNGLLPVPMYYFKVAYNPVKKTATAFISINCSYYNSTMIQNLAFCDDICENNPDYSWLRWRSDDGTYSFCCDYNEFIKKIDYLPNLDNSGSLKKRRY